MMMVIRVVIIMIVIKNGNRTESGYNSVCNHTSDLFNHEYDNMKI